LGWRSVTSYPASWLVLPLSEIIQTQKGRKPAQLGIKEAARKIPYINIAAFEGKPIREYAPEQDVPKCEPADTLLVWDGARAGLAGRGVSGYIGSTLARVTSDLTDPGYLFYFIQAHYGTLNTQTKGVGIPHINPVVLNSLKFGLAPCAEQTRIVEKLEELLSDLEAGVTELKAAQKKLAQYRQSLLKAAVEGALTGEWRKGQVATPSESGAALLARILTERRSRRQTRQLAKFQAQGKPPPKDWQAKYPEPVALDTAGLPALPSGWVWASVEQIASDERYSLSIGPFGSNLKVPDYREEGVPLVFVRNIRSGNYGGIHTKYVTQEKAEELRAHSIAAGDVLITKMGEPPGDADVYPESQPPAVITADCIKVRCWPELMLPHFLKAVINSYIGQRQIEPMTQGVAQKKVSLGRFTSLVVPVPSYTEQIAIMEMVAAADVEAAVLEISISNGLKQSAAQRKNILQAALSGQLVPQDPADEPASALLARIRAERVARGTGLARARGKKTVAM
jgi:type I restriction enzyme, S subunit